MIAFTLRLQQPSGKNQVQQLWREGQLKKIPNVRFKRWRDDAGYQLIQQRVRPPTPISTPVSLYCTYTPGDRITRDIPGMEDALYFLIVWAGVLKNDGLVYDCLWRRRGVGEPSLYVEIHDWKEPA